jgi:hypothetical protein
MADLYSRISDVGLEYGLASKRLTQIAHVQFSSDAGTQGFRFRAKVLEAAGNPDLTIADLRLLCSFKKIDTNVFATAWQPAPPEAEWPILLHLFLRPYLLNHPLYPSDQRYASTPICDMQLFLPEEIPIILTSFHLSSIVRYKPEFFARVRDSRFWPIVAASRQHCLFKFLLLTWSFLQQRDYIPTRV